MPDAITTSILLMVVLFVLSLALGARLSATMDAYYRGLWNLLAFTMQMTLILVLSLILGATPVFKRRHHRAVAPAPTRDQVVVLAVLCGALRRLPELGAVDRAVAGDRDPLRAAKPSARASRSTSCFCWRRSPAPDRSGSSVSRAARRC